MSAYTNDIAPLQHTATHCNTPHHTAPHCKISGEAVAYTNDSSTHCNTLQHTTTHYHTWRHTVTHCDTLDEVEAHTNDASTHYNTLQHAATRCNILQYTATHCNTLPHIRRGGGIHTWHCNTLLNTATHRTTSQHTAYSPTHHRRRRHMGWLWLVGSIKLQASFAKEHYKRANILQKRPMILSIILTVATPYTNDTARHYNTLQHTATHCNTSCEDVAYISTPRYIF